MTRIFLLVFLLTAFTSRAANTPDSLKQIWNSRTAPDSSRLKALNRLVDVYYLKRDPDSALLLSEQGYIQALQWKEKNGQAMMLMNMGDAAIYMHRYEQALVYFEKCKTLYIDLNNNRNIATCFNSIGRIYLEKGLGDKAVQSFYEAYHIRVRMQDKQGIANSMHSLGHVYYFMKNYKLALACYKSHMQINQELGNKDMADFACSNVGLAYMDIGDYYNAAIYLRRAAAMMMRSNDRVNKGKVLYNLGATYDGLELFDSAAICYNQSLAIRQSLDDTTGIAVCYNGMGESALARKRNSEAVAYGEKALALIRTQKQSLNEFRAITEFLHRAYKAAGNYEKALEVFKLYDAAGDSLNADIVKNAIFREELKNDFEKKALLDKAANDLAVARLNLAREQDASRSNAWMQLFAGISLLLLVVGYFMYNRFRQRKIIAEQKANLLKQKLLVSQLNPHFIFNSLNAVQQYIFSQNSLEAGTYLARFSSLMRMILDFSRADFIPVASEVQFLTEYLDLQQLRFAQSFRYTITIDPSVDPEEVHIPPMLAQPFIENAVEHGISRENGDGHISIRLYPGNGLLWYEVEDNGIGLEAAGKKKESGGHRSLATQITRERLDALNKGGVAYTISVTDKTGAAGSGVLVRISIPYSK